MFTRRDCACAFLCNLGELVTDSRTKMGAMYLRQIRRLFALPSSFVFLLVSASSRVEYLDEFTLPFIPLCKEFMIRGTAH